MRDNKKTFQPISKEDKDSIIKRMIQKIKATKEQCNKKEL